MPDGDVLDDGQPQTVPPSRANDCDQHGKTLRRREICCGAMPIPLSFTLNTMCPSVALTAHHDLPPTGVTDGIGKQVTEGAADLIGTSAKPRIVPSSILI